MKVQSIDYMTNPEPSPSLEACRTCDFCNHEIFEDDEREGGGLIDWISHKECVPMAFRLEVVG